MTSGARASRCARAQLEISGPLYASYEKEYLVSVDSFRELTHAWNDEIASPLM